MPRVSGDQHYRAKANSADQEKVLQYVSEGMDPAAAMAMVGRQSQTLYQWIYRSKKFASELEKAKTKGNLALKERVGTDKYQIPFDQFSKNFLGNKVFAHHQDWIDVLEGKEPSWLHPSMVYDAGSKNRLLINVPPEHAKSTVVTVGYSTYRIAMDPNVRIIVVSKTLVKAREFVYAIKQRLSHPRWGTLQNVYGPAGGWKQDADTWRTDTVYLGNEARDSSEKDPTIQALGMGGQIYGARADLIILDDVVTTANAHEWPKQIEWLQKEVITRLGKNGKLLVVGTRIAPNDLYRELRNPEHWSGGKSPFTYLAMPAVLEFNDKPSDWVTLWPKSDMPWDGDDDPEPDEEGLYPKWDGPALFTRRSEVTPSTWALVYQQQDVEEESIFPTPCVMGSTSKIRRKGPIRPDVPGHPKEGQFYTVIGLDPAMAGKTAGIVYAFSRDTKKRYVLDANNMSDPTPGKIRALLDEWVKKYHPNEVRIEINAFQKAFALDEDLRQWLSSAGVQFREHFTGKNKWDTNFGVASMAGLFGTLRDGKFQQDNLIELPMSDNEDIKALINQLITWKPDTKSPTDLVMALWFCEIRAREMLNQGTYLKNHLQNRYATRANLATRGSINLDEYASAHNDVIYI